MPTPLQIDLFGIACVLALAVLFAVLVRRVRLAERKAKHAQAQLDYVIQFPPPPRVLRARLKHPHRFSDPEKEFFHAMDRGQLVTVAFTTSVYSGCKVEGERVNRLIAAGEAEVGE